MNEAKVIQNQNLELGQEAKLTQVKELINGYLKTLKEEISDEKTYEHIIASILEIHDNHLSYSQVFDQITKDIENITEPENSDILCSTYFLAKALAGYDEDIKDIYREDILLYGNEQENKIIGDIYNFIDQNSQLNIMKSDDDKQPKKQNVILVGECHVDSSHLSEVSDLIIEKLKTCTVYDYYINK